MGVVQSSGACCDCDNLNHEYRRKLDGLGRKLGSHIGIPPDFTIYSLDEDRQQVLSEAKKRAGSAGPRDTDKFILERIDKLKAMFATPESTQRLFRNQDQGAQYAAIYRAYEEELQRLNALDFSTLVMKTATAN